LRLRDGAKLQSVVKLTSKKFTAVRGRKRGLRSPPKLDARVKVIERAGNQR
jgi:hypothetical protein